jgi:Zn finger protein HypA/HybF involved in hydrogenase expression
MSKYDWQNKDKFITDFKNSNSICNFLIKNGLTATSGNYQTFVKWYDIHMNNIKVEQINIFKFEDIFKENSTIDRGRIKLIIERYKLMEYKCKECENNGIWNNKKLNLQLEHINGINNDNRIENLAYLCPNCHSQTETYAGNNRWIKLFNLRINDLIKMNIISEKNFHLLADKWNIDKKTTKIWLKKYKKEIEKYSVIINFSEQKERLVKKERNDIFLTKKIFYQSRVNDLKQYQDNPEAFKILNELWKIDNSKRWIKANHSDYYEKMNKHNIDTYLKPIEFNIINIEQRQLDLSLINDKKEIKILTEKWNIFMNGVKKWIKENNPERFKEIYDDKHLMKNKKIEEKKKKTNYVSSFTKETFNLEEAIVKLQTNKSGVYALLRQYNPTLLDELQSSTKCIHCSFKTRTSGKNKVGNIFYTRYKCLNPNCKKSFLNKNDIA